VAEGQEQATGAAKGLGREIALGLAGAGADVVVASRKIDGCERVASEIRGLGRRALAQACHVGDWSHCELLVERTIDELGRLAAKAGLNALTVAAAKELGPRGIRVNAIVCGAFRTDSFDRSVPTLEMEEALAARIPLGRIAAPTRSSAPRRSWPRTHRRT
jgi:NAD(P)-dependent dehydrogenase (short-subunit alcohol dehydrogenase family)